MIIFDENSQPVILDNIYCPTLANYFWVLDLQMMDYTLTPLIMLEETVCSSMKLNVNGFEFILPAFWSILVFDSETSQLDLIELSDATGKDFTAFVHGPNLSHFNSGKVSITDYYVEHRNVGPALNKHQLLCHPISETEWISVSPANTFNKYLKDMTIGDILH
jgi:hypothetical protein